MSVREKIIVSDGEQKEIKWWIADYKDGAGKRHQVRFKYKRDAEAHEEKSKVAIRSGTYVSLNHDVTVEDAAKVWLKRVEANGMRHRGPVERTTSRQYREHVDLHIGPRIGRLKLAKLAKADIEAFRDKLLSKEESARPMSRSMARKVLVSLKSLLKANGCAHVADDVTIGMDGRSKRRLEIGRDIPTTEEIKRLNQAAAPNPKLHALLLVAAQCGLRASELRGLPWSCVDLKAEELHVRQRADRYSTIGPPKTKESRRTISLSPEAVLALKKWKLACPKGDLDLVFPTSTGAVEHHSNMLRSLRPVMRAGGVMRAGKSKYALHAFRHFFASWCINPKSRGGRQLPPKEAQELLGHSSIVMTMDLYGHLFPSGSDRSELATASKALLG